MESYTTDLNIIKHQIISALKQSSYVVIDVGDVIKTKCFDMLAKKDSTIIFIKLILNIDNFQDSQAFELKLLAEKFNAIPLIIGVKTRRHGIIEDGIVYFRHNILAISPFTFIQFITAHEKPLAYFHYGGLYVRLNGEKLKQMRLKNTMSLGDLAKKVGVSKRAIFEYERNRMNATINTAIALEEIFGEDLVLGIDIFEENLMSRDIDEDPSKFGCKPKNKFEKRIQDELIRMGMREQFWSKRSPLDVISGISEINNIKFVIGISRQLSEPELRKFSIIKQVSILTKSFPIYLSEETLDEQVTNMSVISLDTLEKLDDFNDLFSLLSITSKMLFKKYLSQKKSRKNFKKEHS